MVFHESTDGRDDRLSASEKRKLEHQAARLFMRLYEAKFGVHFRHIWHNEPRKPDVSAYLGEQKLDLEIAHLYGSEQEAMLRLGRELSEKTRLELAHLQITPPDHRMLEALNRLLHHKSNKAYHTHQAWLVIRNANPLWTTKDFIQNRHLIKRPAAHPFDQIWLIGDFDGQDGEVLRLDKPI